MATRLAEHLSVARHRQFVGRTSERALFQSALVAAEWPFYVLYVYGPGGVGKTTLLNEFAQLCAQAGMRAIYLDAHNIDPSPEALINALRFAMGLTPQDAPLQVLASQPARLVLLIDTYESFTPLDGWLREVLLPQLPDNLLVVLAGRHPPAPAWRTDLGWQAFMRTLPLRNLSPEESCTYLTQRGVPATQHQAVLDFTHGHPLALSLVADMFAQRRDVHFQPQVAPDVIKTLLEVFVQKVPGPAHRAALEACALVRITTESLLAEMLVSPDVHELFAWLRELSFIESGPRGLFPHDLARETLVADVRWRNPAWYAELHRRARHFYMARLEQTHGHAQQRVLLDYVFLHRDNPVVRPFYEWQISGSMVAEAMRDKDAARLVSIVARHEGQDSAAIATHWFTRQPGGVVLFRDVEGQPAGFLAMVGLHQVSSIDLEIDPATRAAWQYLQRHAPLRPGEGATLFRYWMADDTYQAVSPTQSLMFINMVRHYLTTPGLAFTFLPCAEPDFWAPMFAYADLARLPDADFEVGGRRYGVYGHDWRAVPPTNWLALLAEREVAVAPQTISPPMSAESLVVLSHAEFAAAVREALRDFTRLDALQANPLLRSRLVAEQAGSNAGAVARAGVLQVLVKEVVEALQSSPRQAKLFQALYHTYLQPVSTQEKAAELLDLPFSTYRRHLTEGITRATELLWQREIGGVEKMSKK